MARKSPQPAAGTFRAPSTSTGSISWILAATSAWWRTVADVLAKRGIDAKRDVVAHCQTHHRSGFAYMAARLLGFPRIRAYHGSWSEWGNRMDTPVAVGDEP